MGDHTYPQCYYPENDDCFGRHTVLGVSKQCHALRDTDFGTSKCPFYKPYKQYITELGKKKEEIVDEFFG